MKPSASPPYVGAPEAWVAASPWPNDPAASADTLPGSTQRRIRHPSSTPRTSGTGTPPSAAASPSQRSPEASAAKKPAGGGGEEAGGGGGGGLHDRGGAVGEPQFGRRGGVATGQRCRGDDGRAEE